MNLRFSVMFLTNLVAGLSLNFVSGVRTENTKNLKHSESPNKSASPQLYVFGGLDESSKYLSSASQFNSSTGEWDSINDMTISRDGVCGAVVGTKIYLFGGFTGSSALKLAEIYDCETDTYTQFRGLSSSSPRVGCGAAVSNGFIYVAGGNDGSSKLYSNVVRYNIQTTRRENVTPMHTVRGGVQLIEFGGRLYAIGGNTTSVEMFDPATGQWSEMASMHFAHYYSGAAIHGGKIYVRSNLGFEVYSPENDQWKILTPLDNLEASNLVSMNGKLWSIGGGRSGSKGTKSVFVYNTATDEWNKHLDMPVARMYHTSFVVNH